MLISFVALIGAALFAWAGYLDHRAARPVLARLGQLECLDPYRGDQ